MIALIRRLLLFVGHFNLRLSIQRGIMSRASLALLLLAFSVRPTAADDFPTPPNTEQGDPSPISPQEALAAIKLPPGFRATLFAAEPDVQNPIAMSWDARGRLWVAENYTYAERTQRFDLRLRDRIVIFDDADGDGGAG